jgi:O-antigen ligase
MLALTIHRFKNLPLVGAVVALAVVTGAAVGMGWNRALILAGALALFAILVKDVRLAVPLLIVAIPFGPKFEMSFGSLYLATALLIMALTAWVWRAPLLRSPFAFPFNPMVVSLLALSAVLGVSALQVLPFLSGRPVLLLRLIQFYLYIALFFMVIQLRFSPGEIRKLVILFLLVGVSQGALGVIQWLQRPGLFLSGTFDNQHNHFGIYAVFIALLLLGVLLENSGTRLRLAALAGLSVMVFSIVFSFSRGGYTAFIAGIVALLFTPIRRRRKLVLVLCAAALGIFIYISVPEFVRERAQSIILNVSGEEVGISWGTRLQLWQEAYGEFLKNPILGAGTWSKGFRDNFYFRILAEAGLLGMFAFFVLLLTLFREIWKIVRFRLEDGLMRGVATGLFAASFACMVVYNLAGDFFAIHRFMGTYWILLGLILVYGSAAGRLGVKDGP